MEKLAKRGSRLNTSNFTLTTSRAISAVDYDRKKRIIEIAFKTGPVYHYTNALEEQWEMIQSLIPEKEGLGRYINTAFKKYFKTGPEDYYRLIVT